MTAQHEIQKLVREIQLRFPRFFEATLRDKNITLPQYTLLVTLSAEDAVPMTTIAKKLHISKPAITHLVDRLEHQKLLTRNAHPKDRRISIICVTAKGKSAVQSVQRKFIDFMTAVFGRFTNAEVEIIKRFYGSLMEELDKVLAS